jgi:hypothetical protein
MNFRRFSFNSLRFTILVYMIALLIWIGLLVFFADHHDNLWGRVGTIVLIAPFPLGFGFLFILAYGEWLYNEIQAYRLDRSVWIEVRLSRLLKFLLVAVLVGFLALVVAILDERFHQQIKTLLTISARELLRNALIAVSFLVSFSAFSLWAYNLHLKWKRKRLGRELNRLGGQA